MKKILFLGIILLFASCKPENNTVAITDGLLIENITIITPDSQGAINSSVGNVILDGAVIVAVADSKAPVKGKFRKIDGTGKYLIPGLIDSHVHLNNIAGLNYQLRQTHPLLVEEYFERLPKNFLYYGYTTLIDVDNYAPQTIDNLQNVPIGPQIYTCGRKIQVMDDFEMIMNELPSSEKMKLPFLHDKYNERINYPDTLNLDQHSPEVLVKRISSQGNICVKTLYEDTWSGLPMVWELPSKEITKELVQAAHEEGLCVVMHAPSYEGQLFAMENGVDIIAHAMWNWTSDPEKFLDTDIPSTHKALVMEIAERGIVYQPTFRTILGELDILEDKLIENPELSMLYSEAFIDFLKSEDAQWGKQMILNRPKFLAKVNPGFFHPIRSTVETDEQLFDVLYDSYKMKIETVVRLLSENDGNLLFGTDNGAMNMKTHVAGLNGYLEMNHWVDAGVPLEHVFKAATYNNAKSFDLLDSLGSIEVGKKANLLVLDSNPLESINAYNEILTVIVEGMAISRNELGVKK